MSASLVFSIPLRNRLVRQHLHQNQQKLVNLSRKYWNFTNFVQIRRKINRNVVSSQPGTCLCAHEIWQHCVQHVFFQNEICYRVGSARSHSHHLSSCPVRSDSYFSILFSTSVPSFSIMALAQLDINGFCDLNITSKPDDNLLLRIIECNFNASFFPYI